MKLRINQFEFDCERLTLTKGGLLISFNEKPAQLLRLFLTGAEQIHHKSEILERVWPDRVVTEQVVFQNISYLRALFGDHAIKTFPRKGYQWQLPISQVTSLQVSADEIETEYEARSSTPAEKSDTFEVYEAKEKITATNANHGSLYKKTSSYILLSLICLFLVFLWSHFTSSAKSHSTQSDHTVVHVLPFTEDGERQPKILTGFMESNLGEADTLQLQPLDVNLSNQVLFDSPFTAWNRYRQTQGDLILSGKIYTIHQEKLLRFYIQGQYRGWQGYLAAKNNIELRHQISELMEILVTSNYFTLVSDNDALAELTLLREQYRDMPQFRHQLIKLHLELEQFDRADALAQSALNQSPSSLYRGLLYLYKAETSMRLSNWQLAKQNSLQAIKLFTQLKLPQLESLAQVKAAWATYVTQTPDISMGHLNLAIRKAREASEPLQEVKAHLTLSLIASKLKETALMQSHFDLAKQLLDLHQLEDEHQIPVLNRLAWVAKTQIEKIDYYQQILASPYTPSYKSNFYFAAAAVRDYYILQKRWPKALDAIKPWQRTSFSKLTQAHIALAQQDWTLALAAAKTAYTQARIDEFKKDALDAALLILLNKQQLAAEKDMSEYSEYIKQNTSSRWRSHNKAKLAELAELEYINKKT